MSTIKDVRAKIDEGLDKLQAKTEALQAQMGLDDDDVEERISEMENKLKDAAEDLNQKLNEAVSEETRTNIQASLEHLQVQLALGKADGRDAINAKKKQISRAIAEYNAQLDAVDSAEERARAEEFDELVRVYAVQAVALEAELAALEETVAEGDSSEIADEETGNSPG